MEPMATKAVVDWIGEVFEESPGRITGATARDAIPGWDSLGTLSLIAALDERFDLQPTEKEIDALQSVDDIVALLRRAGAVAD
jgi:acyl carrier protein